VIVSAVTARLCVLLKLRTLRAFLVLVVLLNDLGPRQRSIAGTCHHLLRPPLGPICFNNYTNRC
jgi:hypothetical protein